MRFDFQSKSCCILKKGEIGLAKNLTFFYNTYSINWMARKGVCWKQPLPIDRGSGSDSKSITPCAVAGCGLQVAVGDD